MEERTKNKTVKIYESECPICHKEFESQNLRQLRYNFQLHIGACKIKMKKQENKDEQIIQKD